MNLASKIESILFVASKPITVKRILTALKCKSKEFAEAMQELEQKYGDESGIRIIQSNNSIQMVTHAVNSQIVEKFAKSEIIGELTRAQLETLTVIAYRGPITRPELEQIRGVNCAIILRNLLLRGLIIESQDNNPLMPTYELSVDAMRHLGIKSTTDLPEYTELHSHEFIERVVSEE